MNLADLWNRASGNTLTPLQADLQRVTHSDSIDVPPKDVVVSITQASYDSDNRREIMRHLQECLAETGGRWRRAYGGLVLLEELLRRGSPAVPKEIGQGLHFDPIQRLTFLERFEYRDDRRVQGMVRQKATALRGNLLARMEGEVPESPSSGSARSPKGRASPAGQNAGGGNGRFEGFGSDGPGRPPENSDEDALPYNPAFPGFGSDSAPPPMADANRKVHVNGLVTVGHKDDTDSDSSGDDRKGKQPPPAQVQPQRSGSSDQQPRKGQNFEPRRRAMEDSTSSSDDDRRRERRPKQRSAVPPVPKVSPPPAQEADLLGGDDSPAAQAPVAATRPPAAQEDLLGGLLDAQPAAAQQDLFGGAFDAKPVVTKQADTSNLLDF